MPLSKAVFASALQLASSRGRRSPDRVLRIGVFSALSALFPQGIFSGPIWMPRGQCAAVSGRGDRVLTLAMLLNALEGKR